MIGPKRNHFKIVCECGRIIAQCRCPGPGKSVEERSPCTHGVAQSSPMAVTPTASSAATIDDTIVIVADKAAKGVRYKVVASDSSREYQTSDGLAFALGVAVLESTLNGTLAEGTFWKVCHPNDVEIYHVGRMSSGQV